MVDVAEVVIEVDVVDVGVEVSVVDVVTVDVCDVVGVLVYVVLVI